MLDARSLTRPHIGTVGAPARIALRARRLGYAPEDASEAVAAEVRARERPGDPTAARYQGGAFTVEEEIPNPAPLPRRGKKRRR